MKSITKKRLQAYVIDTAINTAVMGGIEYFLRKKVKNEFVHMVITPTVVFSLLETLQLRTSGQTIGYKVTGLTLTTNENSIPDTKQLLKRSIYRDSVGGIAYILKRQQFEEYNGQVLPHDKFAGTIVQQKT